MPLDELPPITWITLLPLLFLFVDCRGSDRLDVVIVLTINPTIGPPTVGKHAQTIPMAGSTTVQAHKGPTLTGMTLVFNAISRCIDVNSRVQSELGSLRRSSPLERRSPLITTVLEIVSVCSASHHPTRFDTYTLPSKKMLEIPIFFTLVICNPATSYKGNAKMRTSMIKLGMAFPKNRPILSMHVDWTVKISHMPFNGVHCKNVTRITAMNQAMVSA